MRTTIEILEVYEKACVSLHQLKTNRNYPAGVDGKISSNKDSAKIIQLEAEKKLIEWLLVTP